MSAATEKLEIDSVDFEIPCRRFTIRAMITRDRQLPVVEEFLLRMLAVLDRVSIRRLRTWFGFTEAEIETVLVDLESKAQVEVKGDDVLLAPGGRELFKNTPAGAIPRLVEVAPIIDHVWFDLVSRNMVPRSRARAVDYLVRLKEQPSARDLPATFAREAFESNFRDYARRIARLDDPDAVNIYSVSEVEAGTYSYQSVRAEIELDPSRSALRPRFSIFDDDPGKFQLLTMTASDEWRGLTFPETSQTSTSEYERLTGDARLAPLMRSKPTAETWHELLANVSQSGFRRSLGAAYLERNVTLLVDTLKRVRTARAEPAEFVWLRPSGTGWGRSRRVAEALHELRDTLRNGRAPEIRTRLVMPRATARTVRKAHRRLFDRGQLLPQGHMAPNLEILVVDNIAALVSLHLDLGGYSVPVGGIVTERTRLDRIIERLNTEDEWETIWQPNVQTIGESSD
ncbi:hypothetical protein GOC53_19815 [Sinorhizobium medicae]|nr:hypothetical protein [Sinorhizobium medicae]